MLRNTLLAAVAGAALATAAFADEHKTIVENAAALPDFSTLVAAVQAGGLVDTLSSAGPFTVFAPTNEAFGMLAGGTVDNLLKPENKDALVKVLTCHVVGAEVMADAVVSMINNGGGTADVATLGGCTLKASLSNGTVLLEDERGRTAQVTATDVKASNGVIHVIDQVILPAM